MTILDRLLSALGLGGDGDDRETAEPTVTVEHEPDAGEEAAVKGVDVGTAEGSDDTAEAVEGGETDEAEADEAAEAVEKDVTEGEEAERDVTEGEEADDAAEPAETAAAESVETIKGIGPAYAGKLGSIGIETVGDLADADADAVAERTSLSEKRVGRWIERARERRDA